MSGTTFQNTDVCIRYFNEAEFGAMMQQRSCLRQLVAVRFILLPLRHLPSGKILYLVTTAKITTSSILVSTGSKLFVFFKLWIHIHGFPLFILLTQLALQIPALDLKVNRYFSSGSIMLMKVTSQFDLINLRFFLPSLTSPFVWFHANGLTNIY